MYGRFVELERGAPIDLKTGRFAFTLFTDGEASDGHIINIAGMKLPRQMPLFVNHWSAADAQLGSIVDTVAEDHRTRHVGVVELGGDGQLADVRRDMAFMLSQGHLRSMSGRWDAHPKDVKRRTELPEDHFAFVPETERGPRRWGLYFAKSRALEGSVVGLGADPAALVGRSQDGALPTHVRDFWTEFAHGAETQESFDVADVLLRARLLYGEARARGVSFEDFLNGINGLPEEAVEVEPYERAGRRLWLPRAVIADLDGEARGLREALRLVGLDGEREPVQDDGTGDADGTVEPVTPEDAGDAGAAPQGREAQAPSLPTHYSIADMGADEFFARFAETLSTNVRDQVRAGVRAALGRV